MPPRIFGIRHHGPGSARTLLHAFDQWQPDIILVEGPPDADEAIPLLAHPEMSPPVALLVYDRDRPQRSVYYPYAAFSPEWQALRYGLTRNIPVQFMDLPQTHRLAVEPCQESTDRLHFDPLGQLAEAAGYSDGERWWEQMVEQRRDGADIFEAILEAMSAVRQELDTEPPALEAQREAYMRQTIRHAIKQGYDRPAVVCGAWHAPALAQMPLVKHDRALLKGLPKTKVNATWVPWTYGRLAASSGYGAGIESPGWYAHLWEMRECDGEEAIAIRWLTRVAQLLRNEDLDASSASVIEAVRLAGSLAALRDRPAPSLADLNEAAQTVMCFGSDAPMALIRDQLIVGDRLGEVPAETPMVPLQTDVQQQQKRLRLKAEPTEKTITLDLRKPTDLERSYLLHRLRLLGIPWGKPQQTRGIGTFKEGWQLQWHPEFEVLLIEAAIWGNTLLEAATHYARDAANRASELPELTDLLNRVLLSELPDAIAPMMAQLQAMAAVTRDVVDLMAALPPLARSLRYGNVRQTDTVMVSGVVDGLVVRICIGLPGACHALNDDAAAAMDDCLMQVHGAIALLQNPEYRDRWYAVLQQMQNQQGLHGLLAGRCCRLLLDGGILEADEAARRMGLALSTANEPSQAAAWVEGFLKGSGLLLLYDDRLWQVIDDWLMSLSEAVLMALLPLLRRTFSTFSAPERRQMLERANRGTAKKQQFEVRVESERGDRVLPVVAQLLGVKMLRTHL